MTANELLHQSILKILVKKKLKLFGCLIYKFDLQINNIVETAACTIINKKPTIFFNSDFIESSVKSAQEMIFIILHEMMHFIDGHLSPAINKHKDRKILNLAMDHVINSLLIEDMNSSDGLKNEIATPNPCFTIDELKGKNLTVLEIYNWLMDRQPQITFIPCKCIGDTGEPSENIFDVYIDGKFEGKINLDINQNNDVNGDVNETDSESISSELKSEIRSILNNILIKGNNTGKLLYYLEQISKLEVPWNILLENTIQTTRVRSNSTKSWKNIRKKYRNIGITLPDNGKELIRDHLYIIQDTSGSMSDLDQAKFIDLILQSINFFKSIKIFQHDHEVKNILELTQENFNLEKDNIFKIYGRGGTSHKDCFDKIEQDFFEENIEIGLIILCTDFESDIEQIWNNYEFHKYIGVKVLCTSKTSKIPNYVDNNPIYC